MGAAAGHQEHHGPMYYVKLWAILLVMLVVSIIGPEFGIKLLTLITAFGIALVKAYMVAAYFMHLNTEKRIIHYMLYTMLLFVGIFFAGVCVDVMRTEGENWHNTASEAINAETQNAAGGHGNQHGDESGEKKEEH